MTRRKKIQLKIQRTEITQKLKSCRFCRAESWTPERNCMARCRTCNENGEKDFCVKYSETKQTNKMDRGDNLEKETADGY